jgi:hypothetical protein
MTERPPLAAQPTDGSPDLWQCGRCRQWFDAEPDAHANAHLEWWLCPPCHVALLGAPRQRGETITSGAKP